MLLVYKTLIESISYPVASLLLFITGLLNMNVCVRSIQLVVAGKIIMEKESFSRKIGLLRAGWWIIHLIGIAAVYALGHLLWR